MNVRDKIERASEAAAAHDLPLAREHQVSRAFGRRGCVMVHGLGDNREPLWRVRLDRHGMVDDVRKWNEQMRLFTKP